MEKIFSIILEEKEILVFLKDEVEENMEQYQCMVYSNSFT